MAERNPLKTGGEVEALFDELAPRYDFFNHLFSFGLDFTWRYRAVRRLAPAVGGPLLDGATGSADLAVALARRYPGREVVGVDFSERMLEVARKKVARFGDRVRMQQGDLMALPFAEGTFAGAACAFGIRNVEDRPRALAEFRRVIRTGGALLFLEPAMPTLPVWAPFYTWYFRNVMPAVAGLAGLRETFVYLFESVRRFPPPDQFCRMMEDAGFSDVTASLLTLGTAAIYRGVAA